MRLQSLALALAFCAISVTAQNAVKPNEALSTGSNAFGLNLFQVLSSSNRNKNLISSPLSAFIALSMVERGARGKTSNSMRQSLHLPHSSAVTDKQFQNLIRDLNNVKEVTLEVANKVFVSNRLRIKSEFLKLTKEIFMSEAAKINVNNPSGVAKSVNNWVGQKTHNKITSIINPDDITQNTRILLVNAIYFKGKWKTLFDKKNTKNLKFHTGKNSEIQVPTMFAKSNYRYSHLTDLKAQIIHLPYVNKDVEMVIIVPDEKDGLSQIVQKLKTYDQEKLLTAASSKVVQLYLPKFKIQSTIDLKEPLKTIGLGEIFTSPNLRGISDDQVAVSSVKQKAFIEVNEEGSEAAAVTVIQGVRRSSIRLPPPPRPIILRVDRPFYFLIRKSQVTLFQGHIRNPIA